MADGKRKASTTSGLELDEGRIARRRTTHLAAPAAQGDQVGRYRRPGDGADRRPPVLHRLPVDRHPRPQLRLHHPDDPRLLRRRQDRPRGVRHPEAGSDPARRDARDAQGRGRRGRGPVVLDQPGHRPQGHPARGVQQRVGRRDPGCVHDHPAVRQGPLPHPGALLEAQGEGSDPVAQDREPVLQGRGARGLPQHHLLRSRRVRRAGGGAGVLRGRRQGPQPAAERRTRVAPQRPQRPGPRQRQGVETGAQGSLPVRRRRDGRDGRDRVRRTRPCLPPAS